MRKGQDMGAHVGNRLSEKQSRWECGKRQWQWDGNKGGGDERIAGCKGNRDGNRESEQR